MEEIEIEKAKDSIKQAEIIINESNEKNEEKKMEIKIKELESQIQNNENENIKKEIDQYKKNK